MPLIQKGRSTIFGIPIPDIGFSEKYLGQGAYMPVPSYSQPSRPASNVLGTSTQQNIRTTTTPTTISGGGTNYREIVGRGKEEEEDMAREQRGREEEQNRAMMRAIEDEYSNVMGGISSEENRLNLAEQGLTQQLPITESQIAQSYGETKPAIEQERAMRLGDYAGQQATAEQQTGGLLSRARRTYNELLSGASKFGGSAAQGYGELLGRSTAQTMGEAKQNLVNTVTKIQSEIGSTRTFYQQKLTDLEKNKNLATEQARRDFRNELAKVSQARYELGQSRVSAERTKSTRNLQQLANFKATIAQINNAAAVAKRSLDQWAMERNAAAQEAAQREIQKYRLTFANINDIAGRVAQSGYAPTTTDLGQIYGYTGSTPDKLSEYLRGVNYPLKGRMTDLNEENPYGGY